MPKPKTPKRTMAEFRFKPQDKVFVIDGNIIDFTDRGLILERPHIYRFLEIKEAVVREQHLHATNRESYTLDGNLLWDCYPGSRVFATWDEAGNAMQPEFERQKNEAEELREEYECE